MEFIATKIEYLPHPAEPDDDVTAEKLSYIENSIIEWIVRKVVKKDFWRRYIRSKLVTVH